MAGLTILSLTWKIVIIVSDSRNDPNDGIDGQEITYNARKCVLADGPRPSEYFVRLFESNFSEAQDKTSRIELNDLQAKAFPEFLDYMYSTAQKASFNTDTATALHSLAKYFGVVRLQNEVKKFCLENMQTVDTCGTYYELATILQEKAILKAAAKYCRDSIGNINSNTSRLLRVPDPQFWLDLMKKHAENGIVVPSLRWTFWVHIVAFCNRHADVLPPEIFKQLTNEAYLPMTKIHPVQAIVLLDAERRIIGDSNEQQGRCDDELSSLQLRCVNAIAQAGQEELRQLNVAWVHDMLRKLPHRVLYEIITRGFIPLPLF
jgi:BTB/POZ domain